ncbi:DNA helicase II [Tepidimonas fonticaldi]|uniref:DNA 3'-5' helicase n=1 Tax=Tepidimonas fonticaldi TaxID=1101373 RepID=A0A1A6DV06_9BURK|nr:UvrD-helicase domain-containing protein [Tepidimonas fonticaldi]OBS30609.1 DNA helicase II [Tepidimonas fonticaldi]TSE38002.1 DNA helicase II [Tepidimonas fonticaldi]
MTDLFADGATPHRAPPSLPPDHPLLRALNPEQLAAVTLPPVHALVLAGAGSGKTRVLTTRIAWLLATGQASPGAILAVTFTNKAAKEMLARLSALLPLNVRGMWIGTFHGLCHRLLRAHHALAGLPATFQILDTQDQLSAIKRLLKALGVDEERVKPKELQWFIAGAKEDGLRPRDMAARDEDTRQKIELYRRYEEQCQREGVVDFGELMLRSYELLRDHEPLRVHYQRRFRHLLIDEFQDTNRLQYAWIKLLAGDESGGRFVPCGNAVMAVGDDDQSIYAFRGARVGNMSDFVREFGIDAPIKLEQNYRSVGHILHAANHLIDHNRQRLGKNLRTEQGEGDRLRVVELPSDFEEAQWVIDEIRQLTRQDGLPPQEIALLYRSNAQSRALEGALFNAGIPYRVYGGLRFFERAEIKHALAYLRLLENPHDDTSFLRVVNFPPRGIGARTIEQLQQAAREGGCSLHDAVTAVGGKGGAHLVAFVAKLDVMRERSVGRPLREIIEGVLADSGLVEHYRAEREGAERIENLEELVNAAESFVSQEGFGREAVALPLDETGPAAPVSAGVETETGETVSPLVAFLTHAALEAGDHQAQAGQAAVQLMTVHAAKGLEFDAVFITGLEEGLFPHENSLSSLDGLEEERRLMYVAITRARRRLYLTHAQTRMLHGQTRYHIPSRFLDELPEDSLQWLSPRRARAAGGWGGGWAAGGAGAAAMPVAQPAWGRSALGDDRPAGMAGIPVARAPARSEPAVSASGAEIRTGMAVFHTKFGEGRVLAIEGQGADARAQVDFRRHGTKWLALAVAKLTPVA